jgi:hypothetical protein
LVGRREIDIRSSLSAIDTSTGRVGHSYRAERRFQFLGEPQLDFERYGYNLAIDARLGMVEHRVGIGCAENEQ